MSSYDRVFGGWLDEVAFPTQHQYSSRKNTPHSSRKNTAPDMRIIVVSKRDETSGRLMSEVYIPFGPNYAIQSTEFHGPLPEEPVERVFTNLETLRIEQVVAETTCE